MGKTKRKINKDDSRKNKKSLAKSVQRKEGKYKKRPHDYLIDEDYDFEINENLS